MRTLHALRFFLTLLLICAFVWTLCGLSRPPVFEGGSGYELYTGTSSGAIIETQNPALAKFFCPRVLGESARFEGDRCEELRDRFQAHLLFTEEAAGVTNYYLYSPLLGHGTVLCGEVVNLHIAVCGERTAAGTPLIFGGF